MTEKEIVKECIKERGYTQLMLAQALGYKTQSGVSERINAGTKGIQVDTLFKMLDVLGYDIIIKDRKKNGQSWKVEYPKED